MTLSIRKAFILAVLLSATGCLTLTSSPPGTQPRSSTTQLPKKPGICPRKQSILVRRKTCPLAVDENSPPDTWGPWTHRPQCVGRKDASSKGGKFCVYTSSFAGYHGISVITRPETAASDILGSLEELYQSTYPSPETVIEFVSLELGDAYEVVDIPGKGKGVVARRKIKKLETFMVDFASLITDLDFPTSTHPTRRSRMLVRAVEQLVEPQEVFGLARSSGFEEEVVEDIMGTNAFNAKLAGLPYKALYPLISVRINHACKPNSFFRYASNGLRAGVGALRDIEPGEELTISYTPIHLPSPSRRALIRNQWGFTCTCPLCSLPPQELAKSDANRDLLFKTKEAFLDAIKSRDRSSEAIDHLFELLRLLLAEDLVLLLREPYDNLAKIHRALGRMEEAKEFAGLRMEVLEMYNFLDPGERDMEREGMRREYGIA